MPDTARFLTTRWTVVLSSQGRSVEAKRALDELCVAYWFPLFVHLRRSGVAKDAARDTVQDFVAWLLENGRLEGADRASGPFRAYLLGALRHFVANQKRQARAMKRDGGRHESLGDHGVAADLASAASRYNGSTWSELSPGEAFDRAWAQQLIQTATERLKAEYEERGKGTVFDVLEDTLDGSPGTRTHEERAAELGCTVGAVKVAAHRLRARLGELIRTEVSHTIDGPETLGDELGTLIAALRGRVG